MILSKPGLRVLSMNPSTAWLVKSPTKFMANAGWQMSFILFQKKAEHWLTARQC